MAFAKARVLPGLAIISLTLCLATVALWVRSWHKGQSVERVDPRRRIVITSTYGVVQLTRWDGAFQPPSVAPTAYNSPPPGAWRKWMYWHGRNIGDTGPTDWAYPPAFSGSDRWWQNAGFDAFDYKHKPLRNPNAFALHDWLQPQWLGRERSVVVPYWAIAVAFCMLPGIVFLRFVGRGRHFRAGVCPSCGYDLRATPHRCPECGKVITR
jgi:hypothetical protein